MWSAYALRNIAWREQHRSQQEPQLRQHSQGGRDADAALAAAPTEKEASKLHATKTRATVRSTGGRNQSSTSTKKKSAASNASWKAGRGWNADGATQQAPSAGPQRGVHAQVRAQAQAHPRSDPHPHPHPMWNAAVGGAGAAAGSTITLPLTINLNMTQGEASQLTNDSMLLSCATSGTGAAAGSNENVPFEENVPLGQKSVSSGSHNDTFSSSSQKPYSDGGSRVPLGQKSLSSGSQATTTRSQSQPQRVCLPTAILHPALGGGPSDYARRRMEERIENEKKDEEPSGQVSIWKRAEQDGEADGTFLALMSAPCRPPFLHFDPKQRVYPHYNRWKRVALPAPAQPVAQPPLLPASMVGPTAVDGVIKQQTDQACQTRETDLVEASKELKAEASRARKELEAEAEAALENQRQEFEKQRQEVQRLLDDAREVGHALRDDLHKEHSKAKSSLKKMLDRGLNITNDAFRSKLTDIKSELLKDILPFTQKYCEKWLAMFHTQDNRKEKVEHSGEKRGNKSSASATAVVHPTPCDRKSARARNLSCTPCTAVATKDGTHSPNAGGVQSKPSESEGATVKPRSRTTASTAKHRKQLSSSPKTVSSRSLTPAESKSLPKTAPSKGSTPIHNIVTRRLGNTTESQNQTNRPTRAKTSAKHPTLTPLQLISGTTKSPPVQPPTNTPMRPSQKSGPVKRPRELVAEAALPPRKKPATRRRRGLLTFSPMDDESAAFL